MVVRVSSLVIPSTQTFASHSWKLGRRRRRNETELQSLSLRLTVARSPRVPPHLHYSQWIYYYHPPRIFYYHVMRILMKLQKLILRSVWSFPNRQRQTDLSERIVKEMRLKLLLLLRQCLKKFDFGLKLLLKLLLLLLRQWQK